MYKRLMKNILIIVLIFIGNILFAQGPQIVLDIKLTNENTSKKLAGASVEVYKDDSKISTSTTSSKGTVDLITVPVGHIYKIKFKKDGFVTKMIEIDGNYDTVEDLDDEIEYSIPGKLFESIDGVDFSFLENNPILKLAFTADGFTFEWDNQHYNTMKGEIADLKNKIIKEKEAVAKKEKEELKRKADFQSYVDAGNRAVANSDYQIAIDQYNLALKLIDKPEIKTKLLNVQKLAGLKAKNEKANLLNKDYADLMNKAKELYDANKLEEARSKYSAASGIKINEEEPKNKIIEINKILNGEKKLIELKAEYEKFMSEGSISLLDNDLIGALGQFKKALSVKEKDADAISKINEVEVLINNNEVSQLRQKDFDALLKKADNLFEKKEWAKSRSFYVKAYAIINDSFVDSQIKKIDERDGEYNKKQYDKMLSKANEYFINENYEISKELYERAIKFLPTYDNTYPINRIQEITDILNPPLAVENDVRELGGKVIGMTEKEMDVLLAHDSEQRKLNEVNGVKIITKEMASEKSGWIDTAKESVNLTKDLTDEIVVDQKNNRTRAEVERIKTEKATNEQRKVFKEVQKGNAIYANQARFNQKEVIVDMSANLKKETDFQSASQKDQSFVQKVYINKMKTTLVTQYPNNDAARINTEVYIIDQNDKYTTERKKESMAQEDAIVKTKVKSNLFLEEIRLSNFDNDIPRQKMVKSVVLQNNEIAITKSEFVKSQNESINSTKDLITEIISNQQKAFEIKDKERAEDVESVIKLKNDLIKSSKFISDKNEDASFTTKDYVNKQADITDGIKQKGYNSSSENQDKTAESIKRLNKDTEDEVNNNQEKINTTLDYISNMEKISIQKIDVNVKNKLGEEFPEGVTEEIYQEKDAYGLLLSFVVRRIVVTGGEGNVYEKTKSRHGVTSYTKNGDAISKQTWQDNTANASLKIN